MFPRVSDPYSFFPDPDPAFEAGDQSVSGSNQDPELLWPKIEIKLQLKKNLNCFLIKNCILPIPRPPYSMSKLQKKPSALKRGHPTLQNMNFYQFFFYFCGSLLPSWIRIHWPDWIRIQSGSGSETLMLPHFYIMHGKETGLLIKMIFVFLRCEV